ncbi:MAG: succinate--CoA ligase subunit beta, partial [Gammaproteobacteria bacterium]|nr:succinate--CoA ligase subunit beta [Gammaproteobacteria bacterium]
REVRQVLIEEGVDIAAEYYLALLLDRALKAPVFVASAEGGTEIEEVAAERPEAI